MKKNRYENIVQKESKKLFNYLLKTLRNREDAEDIFQETFLAFYNNIDRVNPSTYKSYIFTTAYHKALNLIRKRKNNKEFATENAENFQTKKEEKPKEKNLIVKEALSQLTQEEALIIELQFYQKMSYKEIAKSLNTTEPAIDSKLVRTKKKLRKIIKKIKKAQGKKPDFV